MLQKRNLLLISGLFVFTFIVNMLLAFRYGSTATSGFFLVSSLGWIVFFGYWFYSISKEVQDFLGVHTLSPLVELVLFYVTFGLYSIYWGYKYGKLIVECQKVAGVQHEDLSILYLILGVFTFRFTVLFLMQYNLNKIIDYSE
jgi:hypothetical protein